MILTSSPLGNYTKQLTEKRTRMAALLSSFSPPVIQVFPSPAEYYRMRAEFRVWHDDHDELYHIMFDPATKQRIRIDHFPVACQLINRAMQKIITGLKTDPLLRYRLFQINYLATLSDQILVTLLYHRPLDGKWQQQAECLRDRLRQEGFNIHLVGRAAKLKICLDQDYVEERLPVAGQIMIYRQVENTFTQPNASVNISMLEWTLASTGLSDHDLLELYCGNGNFSLALARHFRQVLATEISKASVATAHYNIAANRIGNVKIARLSAEELTQAIGGERQFYRLQGIDLTAYQFGTVLVDPPRCGLDQQTVQMVQSFNRILYISCNPVTLATNLITLCKSHRITHLALFDQFPYTEHIECGVVLEKS